MADGKVVIETGLDVKGLEKGLSKLEGITKKGFSAVKVAAEVASAALAVAGGYAVKVGSDFEAGMSNVSAISGAAGSDLDRLTEKAKEMGAKTKFSATEAADAFQYMAMAGWKTEDMLSGIEGIMNLAAASGEDLATTSDIVTDALTAFGLSAADSTHFADVLAQASSNANTNVSLMGQTFKYVAPVAGALGFSAEDCAVAIGLMANSGIKASQAGTSLRQILANLVKPTDQMQTAMDELGISITDAGGNTKRLDALMGDLRNSFSGLTDSQKAQYAATIAGQEGMSALLALVNASESDYNKLKDSIYNADGAAARMAETMQDNLKGAVEELGGGIETLGIQIYESIESKLRSAVEAGTKNVERLSAAFSRGGLTAAAKECIEIFDEFTTELSSSSDELAGIITPIRNVAKRGLELGQKAIPVVSKAFSVLAKNGNILAAALTAGIVAIKGYSKISTVTALISKGTKAWKAASVAVDAYNVVQIACTAQGVISNATLTAGQAVVGVLTGRVTLATAAQTLWNAAMNANPIGILITGVAALAAGLGIYALVTDDASDSTVKLTEKQKAIIENSDQTIKNIREEAEARQENINASTAEIDSAQALWKELQNCVDENGKVRAGYESRAQYITGELAEALGIEISLVDGVIQNYDELNKSVQDVIASKKAEAVLDALKSEYTKAMQEQAETAADLANKYDALTEAKKKQKDIEAELEQEAKKAKTYIDEVGNTVTLNTGRYNELGKQLKEVKGDVETQQAAFDAASVAMSDNEKVISDYNMLLEASMSGNADTVNNALSQIQSGIDTSLEASSKAALKQAETTGNTLLGILSAQESGLATLEQSVIDGTAESMGMALSTIGSSSENMKQMLEDAGADGSAKMIAAMAQADLSGNMSLQARSGMEGFIAGFAGLDAETKEVWSQAWYGALEGLEGFESLKDPAVDGADAFLESLRDALKVKSPSRAVKEIFSQVWPGAEKGLDSGKESLRQKGGNVITSLLDFMQNGGLISGAKTVGANLMDFFGIGLDSRKENSKASGKANADAANEGAGSVNPTKTGNDFGTMLSKGVSAMSQLLKKSGKEIGDSADGGAASVNPTNTGKTFGTKLSNGVSSMSQLLRKSGKGISDSANSGAGSVNPTGTGNNFGLMLGNGVSYMANTLWRSGNSIAGSADNGAGSVSPFGTGSGFSYTFSNGISSVSLYGAGEGRANDANDGIGSVSAWDAGYNFTSGFGGGMGDFNLFDVAYSIGKNALDAIKKALGIKSPSKETKKVGDFFGQGLAIGIKESTKEVKKASSSLADIAMAGLDMTALAEKARMTVSMENARVGKVISASVEHKIFGTAEIENQKTSNNLDALADKIVDAFEKAGFEFKVGNRNFARLVREVQ